MSIGAKICGLSTPEAVDAAVAAGAAFVGFVFYAPSPRAISPERAAELARRVPDGVKRVGVFVDPDDALLDAVTAAVPLDLIQLHGGEGPDRVRAIAARTGRPAIKAIKVAGPEDVARARDYEGAAEYLLFDSRPPEGQTDALPGGNGIAFDALLVRGGGHGLPWFLSGGLDAANVAEAVRLSGARLVDVSSGVEQGPGEKDEAKIKAFLQAVRAIGNGAAA